MTNIKANLASNKLFETVSFDILITSLFIFNAIQSMIIFLFTNGCA